MNPSTEKASELIEVSVEELATLVGDDYSSGDRLQLALSALSQGGRELCVLAYLGREAEITGDDLQFILWRLGERLKGTADILSGHAALKRERAEEGSDRP